ncbi:TIGR00730 family Rossman fold protein [Nocardia terpenica]|nr:TIGR00730 family Rossman fold protein [Nocardia terpenica]MBF6065959.1 TIGR00730 family Rossman fold protein [Nocardia terpenica]MBF6108845.1 TIGR00730 family Rossman fold protein [Nocardia terpenica]MBF6116203.1 TIGR00730 family Rossman fold protein [Nocardia terpenica]MBF6123204.1 TIGR00730 family Rossman fold protein [Nocardia terpenica]MBF6153114.1 TIGR00730 family Rossman fold protein [Nocardia terpenica]
MFSSATNTFTAKVGVFCGARAGVSDDHITLGHDFGLALAARGAGLVYGAGGTGVMHAVARGVFDGGSAVTGVVPHELREREKSLEVRGEIFVVKDMHARKALMYRLSDAFAVLPGGLGTLDELMEVATWNQLRFHCKPLVLVNRDGFYDPLIALLDHLVGAGFIGAEERALIQDTDDVEDALDLLGCRPRYSPEEKASNLAFSS